jgi:hypothetical protein
LDLSNWNGGGGAVGSQNLPLIAEAAVGNYQFFAELARLSQREGNFGREFGSPFFYFSFPIAAKMSALRDARRAGDTAAADAIAADLKTTWTIWSLAAVPVGRSSSVMKVGGSTYNNGPGAFSGTAVAVAGERWESHVPPQGLAGDELSPLLAWALDLPRSRIRPGTANLLQVPEERSWWDTMIAHMAGIGDFQATTPPEIWGLSAADRESLRRIVQGNASGLDAALATIRAGGGVWRDMVVRIRRTSEGVETVFFRPTNGNKPSQIVTSVTNNGAWTSMRPCFRNMSGANAGVRVWIENGAVQATGDPFQCVPASQAELGGNLIYSVVLRGQSISQGNVTSAAPTDSGDIQPPPGGGGGGGGGGGPGDDFDRPGGPDIAY